jgi:Peptidase A4 family
MPRYRDRLEPQPFKEALETNIKGVYTFEPPPEGFDPRTASNALLKKYHLPLRPDPDRTPQALRAWRRVFNKPLGKFIQPVFQFTPKRGPIVSDPFAPPEIFNTGSAWAGGQLPGNWQSVYGRWSVPDITPGAPTSNPPWICSTWVGINAPPSLIQVGTTQSVDQNGGASVSAWAEWDISGSFTSADAAQPLPGFYYLNSGTLVHQTMPLEINDVVEVELIYNSSGATYMFNNVTKSVWTSWIIPTNAEQIEVAEIVWILETPVIDMAGDLAALPDFGTVTFLNCGGCSADKSTNGTPGDGGTPTEITNNGAQLTDVNLGDSTVTITYIG